MADEKELVNVEEQEADSDESSTPTDGEVDTADSGGTGNPIGGGDH